jgi:hypothetical protein
MNQSIGGNMFKIKDETFNMKYAYLDAFVDDDEKKLVFGLQIVAEDNNNIFDEEADELHFNSEILLNIKPKVIKKWQDIAGQVVEWKNYPQNEEKPHALLYVFEHEEIFNAKIELKNIENKIIVKIKALCDINFDDKFSDSLPLEIETEVDFFGILCGKDTTEDDCKSKIEPFLDVGNLKYVQNKYGVSIMVPKEADMKRNLLVLGDY